MDIKIRKANPEDIPMIIKIAKSNNPSYPKNLVKKEINEMFSQALLKPTYLVAEKNGNIIGCGGFIRSWEDNSIFNIFWINVLADFQGNGVGTKLIKKIVETINGDKGKPKVKMITLSTNKPVVYKRLGFKKLGKRYDRDYFLMGKIIK
jgi:N-acetylglutamate synthase-like GNAT family acetyltransferase